MTETYLGYPPRHITEWIKNYMNAAGGTEQWVDAEYTQTWIFDDGSRHHMETTSYWEDSGMVYFEHDGGECHGFIYKSDHPDLTEEQALALLDRTTVLECESFTAYREYTPGHWEDANGNWIHGEWSAFTPSMAVPLIGVEWDDAKNAFVARIRTEEGYEDHVLPETNRNAVVTNLDENIVIFRTWNNAKERN